MATGKLLPFESLRGLAALSVAVFHFGSSSPLQQNAFILHAYLMVDLFFVLSGYVIALNYADRITSAAGLWAFQQRRFWRLYPLHFVTLLLFVAIEGARFVAEPGQSAATAFAGSDVPELAANLTLTQAVLLEETSFNIPSWSISAEFFAYLAFGMTMLTGRNRWKGLACVWLLCAAILLFLADGRLTATGAPFAIVRCIFGFILGVAAWRLSELHPIRPPRWMAPAFLLGSVAGIVCLAETGFEILLPIAFAATLTVLAQTPPEATLSRLLSTGPLVYLGTLSYGIYMIHYGLRQATELALNAAGIAGLNALSPLSASLVTLAAIAATIGLAHLAHHRIERPWMLRGWPSERAA
jgi:peptidoglycan/LPS O-acetylase OafA/YrhL